MASVVLRAQPAPEDASAAPLAPDFQLPQRNGVYAVVIGIQNYQDGPSSDYSQADAQGFEKELLALGFHAADVDMLVNQDATLAAFDKTLNRWLPSRVKSGDTVVFYYSGHGAPDVSTNPTKPAAYLVPYDGDPNDLADTAYPVKKLYQKLNGLHAGRILVVLDACFSGRGSRSVIAQGVRPLVTQFRLPMSDVGPNMAVLAATKNNEMAAADPKIGHGLLTYNLIQAINQGQADFYGIYRRIKAPVEDQAKLDLNIEQTPQFFSAAPEKEWPGLFQLADAGALHSAIAAAQAAAKAQAAKEAQADSDAAKLAAQEAQLQAQKDQLQQQKQQEQQQIDAERQQLEQQQQNQAAPAAPQQPSAIVPPTF